jgi:Holliday junction resolvasome RuvABC endonuclease subunit
MPDGQKWRAAHVKTVHTGTSAPLHDRIGEIYEGINVACDAFIDLDFVEVVVACETQAGVQEGKRRSGETSADALLVQQVVGIARALALRYHLRFVDVSPQEAKIAVLGRGGSTADKAQVNRAVRALVTGLPDKMDEHSSDAVAIAIAGARKARVDAKLKRAG